MSKTNPELYLLVDGTHADPSECDVGADHMLRHANGVPVALREDGNPQTVADNTAESGNVQAANAGVEAVSADVPAAEKPDKQKPKAKAMTTEKPGSRYKDREMKAH